MKTGKIALFIICTLLLNTVTAQSYSTKVETIYTSDYKSARLHHVKAVTDSKGVVHVVFMGGELNYMFYGNNKNGTWQLEKLHYYHNYYKEDQDVFKMGNIIVDANDNIHIIGFDQMGQEIVYGTKPANGGTFNLQTKKISPTPRYFAVYGGQGVGDEFFDVAIDKNGTLHMICKADYRLRDESEMINQFAAYLSKPASEEDWKLEVLAYDPQFDERNWFYGTNSSIVCYGDKMYVSMGGSNELLFAERNISGGEWEIQTLLSTPDEVINSRKDETSMAISPNGNIKFAFFDGTDADDEDAWRGVSLFSRNNCGNKEWQGFNFSQSLPVSATRVRIPVITFDKNGKLYIAFGMNRNALWHQTCDCNSQFQKIYEFEVISGDVDLAVGNDNTVYAFYTSSYDNELKLLTAIPNENTEQCNYPPFITDFDGKTNLKPGEKWTAMIYASDPECNKIRFESIIHNEIFSLNDNGDGTASITAIMPQGEGKATPGISVWVLDEKHPDTNDKASVITINLCVTTDGIEEGNVKIENKCIGPIQYNPVFGNAKNNNSSGNASEGGNMQESDINNTSPQTGQADNSDCEDFLIRYEKFADEYAPVAKQVKTNPMDMDAINKLTGLMEEFGNYSQEWENLYDCHSIPGFTERYKAASKKIEDANN
jgi:hypothetical protein